MIAFIQRDNAAGVGFGERMEFLLIIILSRAMPKRLGLMRIAVENYREKKK
jgi:hypothetical protein